MALKVDEVSSWKLVWSSSSSSSSVKLPMSSSMLGSSDGCMSFLTLKGGDLLMGLLGLRSSVMSSKINELNDLEKLSLEK